MSADFAEELSSRIQSHEAFWKDLQELQRYGVRSCIGIESFRAEIQSEIRPDVIDRLMYCASVFSQTSDEKNKSLAQTISLNALLSTSGSRVRERSAVLMAQIGNFPGAKFIEDLHDAAPSTLQGFLAQQILRGINSIEIDGKSVPLTDFQREVWRALLRSELTSISAPTSAGKSFLVIEYICQKALSSQSFTAIYVAPTRALLAEVGRKFSARLGDPSDIRVSTVPGLDPEGRTKQIYVLTQERLHVLLSLANVSADIVVVDEAQNLADGARGMILQDCLERIRRVSQRTKVVLLSPGAVGFVDVARLLDLGQIDVRTTGLSPVLQNRIRVEAIRGNPKSLNLSLIGENSVTPIGVLRTERGVGDARTRLAAAALELGGLGGSLVYATGPVEAEATSKQLTADLAKEGVGGREELCEFIKQHIHPDYGLANMVLHGVAFHYGRMPTLLREALERGFSEGNIRYLVCTTTLFQGVNLPARSVFINTPTRGRGTLLEPAQLWNFAGRAGRLGKDIVGNVFLVDYEQWEAKSLDKPASYLVYPALAETIRRDFDAVVKAMSGDNPVSIRQSQEERDAHAAAGLLMARASGKRTSQFLKRLTSLSESQRASLEVEADLAVEKLDLPSSVIESNWTVNLHGLQRLAARMKDKIAEGELEDLVPLHPAEPNAYERYSRIFGRIAREVLGMKGQSIARYGAFIATYAVPWMKGAPYPVLLRKWIDFKTKRRAEPSVDKAIREGFDFFEDVLRFQMVQLGKAYLDVLHYVLGEVGEEAQRAKAFDFALALELGVSTTTGRAFVELGASRIAAVALESLFPDSELTASEARAKLRTLDLKAVALSPVIVGELRQLKLVD